MIPLCYLYHLFVLTCLKTVLTSFNFVVWFGHFIAPGFQTVGEMLGFVLRYAHLCGSLSLPKRSSC